jgi:antibiotic biosynthesis monooxygenase (ABM) superfamily enzyme
MIQQQTAQIGPVHVAITRTVKPGCEHDFEQAINDFFQRAEHQPGVAGAYLIKPLHGSEQREYGILRSFDSVGAKEQFYASELYSDWNRTVAPLVEGAPQRHELHGMEAFFRQQSAPPAWKMALVTWLGVNPAVYLSASAVKATGIGLPMLAELLLVNALVVATLTWGIMPLLTRLAGPWLGRGSRSEAT